MLQSEPRPSEAVKKSAHGKLKHAPPLATRLPARVGHALACQRPLAGAFFLSFSGSGLVTALQTAQAEAAIDVEDLAGGVIQQSVGDGADGFGDIAALAHAALREQAGGDLLVVRLFYLSDHVGADDAGADLEDLDAHLRQALRIERHGHAEGGLGAVSYTHLRAHETRH